MCLVVDSRCVRGVFVFVFCRCNRVENMGKGLFGSSRCRLKWVYEIGKGAFGGYM